MQHSRPAAVIRKILPACFSPFRYLFPDVRSFCGSKRFPRAHERTKTRPDNKVARASWLVVPQLQLVNYYWPLRVRYGGKSNEAVAQDPARGIYLDVTSFLLAAHLEVLDLLAANFERLCVSPWLSKALAWQVNQLTSGQASRSAAVQEVCDLVDVGRIESLKRDDADLAPELQLASERIGFSWCHLLQIVEGQGGYLVDFVSTAEDQTLSASLSEQWQGPLRRPVDVLDLLVNLSKLSREKVHLAAQRLGAQAAHRGGVISSAWQPFIALAPGIAELLARAELLKPLVSCARVAIDASESDHLHAQIRHLKSRDALVGWLQDTRTRLRIDLEHRPDQESRSPTKTALTTASKTNLSEARICRAP